MITTKPNYQHNYMTPNQMMIPQSGYPAGLTRGSTTSHNLMTNHSTNRQTMGVPPNGNRPTMNVNPPNLPTMNLTMNRSIGNSNSTASHPMTAGNLAINSRSIAASSRLIPNCSMNSATNNQIRSSPTSHASPTGFNAESLQFNCNPATNLNEYLPVGPQLSPQSRNSTLDLDIRQHLNQYHPSSTTSLNLPIQGNAICHSAHSTMPTNSLSQPRRGCNARNCQQRAQVVQQNGFQNNHSNLANTGRYQRKLIQKLHFQNQIFFDELASPMALIPANDHCDNPECCPTPSSSPITRSKGNGDLPNGNPMNCDRHNAENINQLSNQPNGHKSAGQLKGDPQCANLVANAQGSPLVFNLPAYAGILQNNVVFADNRFPNDLILNDRNSDAGLSNSLPNGQLGNLLPVTPIDMAEQDEIKRNRKKTKNREAAERCRAKKQEKFKNLEETKATLGKEVDELGGQKRQKLEHLRCLRDLMSKYAEAIESAPVDGSNTEDSEEGSPPSDVGLSDGLNETPVEPANEHTIKQPKIDESAGQLPIAAKREPNGSV